MTDPSDLITDDVLALSIIRHGSLAPDAAETRWEAVRAAFENVESLSDRWYELNEAASDARAAAVAASAEAVTGGKKTPAGGAAKVLEAELAVEGCGVAIRKAIATLRDARRSYDALWDDTAFVAEYREAVAAEFLKRRKAVLKAFNELDANLPALAEAYALLGDFTLDHLLSDAVTSLEFDGRPMANASVFMRPHRSWLAPKLSEAMTEVRQYMTNDDPITGGTLLAEDLDTVAAALPDLVDKRYEQWQDDLAAARIEQYGVDHNTDTGRRYG
ncbi:hypothetical protein ACVV2G_27160 [Streptomyces ziwulingensis]